MRWLTLIGLAAWTACVVVRLAVGEGLRQRAEKLLVVRKTQQGMDAFRTAYIWSGDIVTAEERSRLLRQFLRVAPPKFKWPMRQLILGIAVEQVTRHPERSEAWTMLYNAQAVSGQAAAARRTLARMIALDKYGVTLARVDY